MILYSVYVLIALGEISMLQPERIPCGPTKDERKVHLLEDDSGAGPLSISSESKVPSPCLEQAGELEITGCGKNHGEGLTVHHGWSRHARRAIEGRVVGRVSWTTDVEGIADLVRYQA